VFVPYAGGEWAEAAMGWALIFIAVAVVGMVAVAILDRRPRPPMPPLGRRHRGGEV